MDDLVASDGQRRVDAERDGSRKAIPSTIMNEDSRPLIVSGSVLFSGVTSQIVLSASCRELKRSTAATTNTVQLMICASNPAFCCEKVAATIV